MGHGRLARNINDFTREDAWTMRIEHFALNVADPIGMARWYVEHLGMRIAVGSDEPPFGHFLADGADEPDGESKGNAAGRAMIEIYHDPEDPVPDYAAQPPSRFHLAFVSADPAGDRDRLLAAGATYIEDVNLPDGGYLIAMRDPWGLAIQLARRGREIV